MTVLVLFDFSKAFDLVDHDILLFKLRNLGCSEAAVRWFKSYLADRRQVVIDRNKNKSAERNSPTGVPQGSILGPLFFSIVINDIPQVLHFSKHLLYADALQIYIHCEPCKIFECQRDLQKDIDSICKWAVNNKLLMNGKQTKCMITGTNRFIEQLEVGGLPRLRISDSKIQFVTEARNLGLFFDSKLIWRPHVEHVCSMIWKTLRQLRYNSASLDSDLKAKLVTTLIFPYIDYCCVALTNISNELNNALQKASNAAVRFVKRVRFAEHITPHLNELGWLSVNNRRRYFLGISVFNALSLTTPSYLSDRFSYISVHVHRQLRGDHDQLHIPFARTKTYKKSFLISGCTFWNELPGGVRRSASLDIFKSSLRDFLLRSQE